MCDALVKVTGINRGLLEGPQCAWIQPWLLGSVGRVGGQTPKVGLGLGLGGRKVPQIGVELLHGEVPGKRGWLGKVGIRDTYVEWVAQWVGGGEEGLRLSACGKEVPLFQLKS